MNDIDTCIACGQPKPMRGWCSNCGGVPEISDVDIPLVTLEHQMPNPAYQGHPGFLAVLEEIRATHIRKGADYGTNQDTFANVRASQEFGIPAWLGTVIRANDKISRIKSFAIKGRLENESLEDALLDAANYFAIALTLYREAKQLAAAGVG